VKVVHVEVLGDKAVEGTVASSDSEKDFYSNVNSKLREHER
jgi:hypothetical protein